jgi:polyisoprenoid-binding protein YceI
MHKAMTGARALLLGAVFSQALALAAGAAEPTPPPGPLPYGGKDLSLATAGTYKLDPCHAAVIARVSHIGYSYSIFRFDKVEGTLTWDPAHIAASKLSATVDTASVTTNVAGFAADISNKYLKSPEFPKATFVSTAFRQESPTRGKIDGQFTLMGKTAPMTLDVELVGAGKGFGHPRIGAHAETAIGVQDFGLNPVFGDKIELVIDAEFEQTP